VIVYYDVVVGAIISCLDIHFTKIFFLYSCSMRDKMDLKCNDGLELRGGMIISRSCPLHITSSVVHEFYQAKVLPTIFQTLLSPPSFIMLGLPHYFAQEILFYYSSPLTNQCLSFPIVLECCGRVETPGRSYLIVECK